MGAWSPSLDGDLDLVRHSSEARIALVPPVSIEDCPLLWMVVRSQTYYPEHILIMGAGRLVTLQSWVLTLFGPTNWRRGNVEV